MAGRRTRANRGAAAPRRTPTRPVRARPCRSTARRSAGWDTARPRAESRACTWMAFSRASFTFTGTSVSWLGCAKATTGIARVYLDGVFVREVDTYHPWPTEDYQHVLFRASGLAPGTHTLAIEATGRQNPAASSAYVVVDAFDVQP